jgi:hypothetical protein
MRLLIEPSLPKEAKKGVVSLLQRGDSSKLSPKEVLSWKIYLFEAHTIRNIVI